MKMNRTKQAMSAAAAFALCGGFILGIGANAADAVRSGSTAMAVAYASSEGLSNLLSASTKVGGHQFFEFAKHRYAVVYSAPSSKSFSVAIAIGQWNTTSQKWDLLTRTVVPDAWSVYRIVTGPSTDQRTAVTVLSIKDAATGRISAIHVFDVSNGRASVVQKYPEVYGASVMSSDQHMTISGLNFEVVASWQNQTLQFTQTPLKVLLSRSDKQVGYTLKVSAVGYKSKYRVEIQGTNRLHLNVGQTLSFVPNNAMAGNAAAKNELGVYTNSWNKGPVNLAQANRLFTNSYRFDTPGTYHFAIVPPNYPGLTPDSTVGMVEVIVTK